MADACTNKDESQMPKSTYDWIPFNVQSFKISKTYWWQIEVIVLIQVWVSAGIALFFNLDGGYMGMHMCENSLSYIFGRGTFLYFAFFFNYFETSIDLQQVAKKCTENSCASILQCPSNLTSHKTISEYQNQDNEISTIDDSDATGYTCTLFLCT